MIAIVTTLVAVVVMAMVQLRISIMVFLNLKPTERVSGQPIHR